MSAVPVPQVSAQPAPVQLHVDEPSHVTLHAPEQAIVHLLSPVHEAVAPSPSVSAQMLVPLQPTCVPAPPESVQVEPPAQLPLPPVPSDCVQVDWPSQVVVQPLTQLPVQAVLASQCEVQLAVHSTLQVFICWQSSVMSDGGVVLLMSAPPSLVALLASPAGRTVVLPILQVAPLAHLHTVPAQAQSPLHAAARPALSQLGAKASTESNQRARMLDLRASPGADTHLLVPAALVRCTQP